MVWTDQIYRTELFMVKKATITFGGIDGNITKKVVTDSATEKCWAYFLFIHPL